VQPSAASPADLAVAAGDLVGKPINLPGVNFRSARLGVVLQLSPTCPYCKASMGFYRRLSQKSSKGVMPVVVAFSGDVESMQAQLAQYGVAVQKMVKVDSVFSSHATPALYLVDSAGTVIKRFIGQLDSSTEEQVISLIDHSWAVSASYPD
jgi:hypothetical protein